MSEEVLILSKEDRRSIQIILRICKGEFIRDKRAKREPLFNELVLLEALSSMKLGGWAFGEWNKADAKGRLDGGKD